MYFSIRLKYIQYTTEIVSVYDRDTLCLHILIINYLQNML